VVTFEDGSVVRDTPLVDSYVELFRYDLALRPACTSCKFASIHRQGDITIGDFWGIDAVYPEMNDDKGVSAIMVNTEKGKTFIPALEEAMELKPCKPEQIAARQPNMSRPSSRSTKADVFAEDMKCLPFKSVLKKYTRVGLKRRLIDTAKTILKRQ
jgi:hypothetical protein